MAKKSGSAYFPFMIDYNNNSLKRAYTVSEVLRSAILVFILTRPYSRLGNKIGSIVSTLKHQTITSQQIPEYEQLIEKELTENFIGVTFKVSLIQEGVDLKLSLQFGTQVTELNTLEVPIITETNG